MEEVAHLENRNQGFSWKQIFRIILCGHHVSKAAKIARYLDFLTDSIQNYNSSAATDVESSRVVVAITSTRFLPRRGRR
ncbi:hypothetical protein K0U07_03950 [bacterium]|nr:hypothetical protein [bacterium]